MTKTDEISEIMEKYGIDNRHDADYFYRALKRGFTPTLANIREKQERAAANAALPMVLRCRKELGYYEGWVKRHERCIEVLQQKARQFGQKY